MILRRNHRSSSPLSFPRRAIGTQVYLAKLTPAWAQRKCYATPDTLVFVLHMLCQEWCFEIRRYTVTSSPSPSPSALTWSSARTLPWCFVSVPAVTPVLALALALALTLALAVSVSGLCPFKTFQRPVGVRPNMKHKTENPTQHSKG